MINRNKIVKDFLKSKATYLIFYEDENGNSQFIEKGEEQ